MTRNDNANSHSPSTIISSDIEASQDARHACLPGECRRHLVHEPVAGAPIRQPAATRRPDRFAGLTCIGLKRFVQNSIAIVCKQQRSICSCQSPILWFEAINIFFFCCDNVEWHRTQGKVVALPIVVQRCALRDALVAPSHFRVLKSYHNPASHRHVLIGSCGHRIEARSSAAERCRHTAEEGLESFPRLPGPPAERVN